MIVRVYNNLSYTMYLVLEMQPHVISFYGVTSRIRFMFLHFLQVSRNRRYESEPSLKPSPLTCGTKQIIVLMSVESQTVHIQSTCRVCNKNWECCSVKKTEQHSKFLLHTLQVLKIKMLLRKKLRADWGQEMRAIIRCRIFCLPGCYPKI